MQTSTDNFTLPAIGTRGDYVLPAIIVQRVQLAAAVRYPVEVVGHIGTFGLLLREIRNPRLHIQTHFTCFEPSNLK